MPIWPWKAHMRPNGLAPSGFFFNDTATTEIYTLSLHDALPIQDQLLPPVLSGDADQLRPLVLRHVLDGDLRALTLQIGETDGRGLGHAARLGLRVGFGLRLRVGLLGLRPGARLLRRGRDADLRRAVHRRRRRPLL